MGENKRNQAMIFPDVPKGAKNCSLNWIIQEKGSFAYTHDGLMRAYELDLSDKTLQEKVDRREFVEWEHVKDLSMMGMDATSYTPDTTFWPELAAADHGVGMMKYCGGEMAF
ncbi:hypothetical protein GQ43DRAFT_440074 [Delitschia confertaspora ATCC 74209]|uniref:Uncharacterized protein n=1 Tax=Delitschia confertaspora ATCC 74209 TaxID=1513339 RepID=A0A9P4JM33_9PLEO|nr:hypothetical protein GQ43DRAFT_440074 [Delitschia confertaspora ATCC 74209]